MRNATLLAIALSAGSLVAFPRAPRLQAQTSETDDNATFEVASVKANKSGDNRIGIGFQPGGRFRATNVPLRELISAAYGTPQPLAGVSNHGRSQMDRIGSV